ncbi:MAG TPA: DUF6134 family protein, partial [Chitinophagales bacterium]
MKNLVFILSFLFFEKSFATETAAFDISLFGNKVGEIVITHEKRSDGSDYYRMTTKAKAKVLWIMRDQSSIYDVVYKDGKMLSSSQWAHDNEDTTSCKVVRTASGISATLHDGKKYSYTEIPMFSIVKLYFQEPKSIDHLFQETDGVYVNIASTEQGTYEFKSKNGD